MRKEKVKVLTDVMALQSREILSKYSELVLANKQGLVIQEKKSSFNFLLENKERLINLPVELFLSQYEIPFYGEIDSIEDLGNEWIEVKVRFLSQTPFYYRECMTELLN